MNVEELERYQHSLDESLSMELALVSSENALKLALLSLDAAVASHDLGDRKVLAAVEGLLEDALESSARCLSGIARGRGHDDDISEKNIEFACWHRGRRLESYREYYRGGSDAA